MDKGCLHKITARFEIDLHPSKLGDVRSGVEEHLNASLHKYSEDFDGVVMAVGECKILSQQAMVHPYFPYCRVEAKAPLTLFTPTVDATLTGRVIKVGADYIGLVVLGVINASIPREHIRKEFVCDVGQAQWRSTKHASHIIKVGAYVRFSVAALTHQEEYFAVFGSLKSKKTGAMDYLAAQGGEEDEAGPSGRTPAPPNGSTPAAGKSAKKPKDTGTGKKPKNKKDGDVEDAGVSGRNGGPHADGEANGFGGVAPSTSKKDKNKKEEKKKEKKEEEKSAKKDKKRKREEEGGERAAAGGTDGEGSSKKKKKKDKA